MWLMISTQGLGKRFGQKVAVDSLDLAVGEGEVFGFLGPNGAGKTTTVRMLCCLIAPTSGEATVAGYRVGREDDSIRQNVGILTESPGLYERFSARYNLDLYARLYGVPAERRAAQVERYLRLLGLWERRDDSVGTFSKGMKQKVAIARCIVHEPRVLFLDEPTAGLDPEASYTVREFIAELRSAGRTIFLCTHNLDEADRLCDRIAIMRQRIVATGSPADLRRQLHGSKTVLHLAAPSPAAVAAISALPFAPAVEAVDAQIVVTVADPANENPALVRAAVLAGGDVRYVTELRASLEDVYLNLISEAKAGLP